MKVYKAIKIGILAKIDDKCFKNHMIAWHNKRFYFTEKDALEPLKVGDILLFENEMDGWHDLGSDAYNVQNILSAKSWVLDFLEHGKKESDLIVHFQWFDSYLLITSCKEFSDHILNAYCKNAQEMLDNIEDHVSSVDFDNLFEKYKINIYSGGRSKPGDDDSAFCNIISSNFLDKSDYDLYIDDLLPKINISVFTDSGFIYWRRMLVDYLESEDYAYQKDFAQDLNETVRFRAKKLYSKERHLKELRKLLIKKMEDIRYSTKKEAENQVNSYIARGYRY